MTSFCAVGNDKVVPPSHSGEEAVCMDHYGHLDGENTLTVSGKVGPSSHAQCELGSGSKKNKKNKINNTFSCCFSQIMRTYIYVTCFSLCTEKHFERGDACLGCRRGHLDVFVFVVSFIETGSCRLSVSVSDQLVQHVVGGRCEVCGHQVEMI